MTVEVIGLSGAIAVPAEDRRELSRSGMRGDSSINKYHTHIPGTRNPRLQLFGCSFLAGPISCSSGFVTDIFAAAPTTMSQNSKGVCRLKEEGTPELDIHQQTKNMESRSSIHKKAKIRPDLEEEAASVYREEFALCFAPSLFPGPGEPAWYSG